MKAACGIDLDVKRVGRCVFLTIDDGVGEPQGYVLTLSDARELSRMLLNVRMDCSELERRDRGFPVGLKPPAR